MIASQASTQLDEEISNTELLQLYPETFIADEELSNEQIAALEFAQWLLENSFSKDQLAFVERKVRQLPQVTKVDADIVCQVKAMCAQAQLSRTPPNFDDFSGMVS
jgi:hypothetical protein